MKKGAQDYLIKGLTSDGLGQVVQSAIDKVLLRRQLEEQRRELGRLATERVRLIAELQQQTAALTEANRRKDQFLVMLAHELRNPLAPLRNAVHILRLRGGDWKTVEQVRQMLDRQIGHMSHLVDDLLDVSRIARGKISLRVEQLDFARLLR
jgi:signal transduction histidine kinase